MLGIPVSVRAVHRTAGCSAPWPTRAPGNVSKIGFGHRGVTGGRSGAACGNGSGNVGGIGSGNGAGQRCGTGYGAGSGVGYGTGPGTKPAAAAGAIGATPPARASANRQRDRPLRTMESFIFGFSRVLGFRCSLSSAILPGSERGAILTPADFRFACLRIAPSLGARASRPRLSTPQAFWLMKGSVLLQLQ
jgi:hypothetical protein